MAGSDGGTVYRTKQAVVTVLSRAPLHRLFREITIQQSLMVAWCYSTMQVTTVPNRSEHAVRSPCYRRTIKLGLIYVRRGVSVSQHKD